jgi:hypothetical protein
MRKRRVATTPQVARHLNEGWLDLDIAAMVEVTSEAEEYPVESALVSGDMPGWRAADSGTQTIRLIFDQLASLSSSKKPKQSIYRSSSCDGLQMVGARFEKSCASSGSAGRDPEGKRARA